ncbi:SAM-dependent methyltransferase, partial [Undibacterium sp. LFS511W]|nr:SAM-dependent methyltransferase [Undibacterium luofuense]
AAVDNWPHTLPFVDMHDFGDMLVNAGFSTPVMDMEKLTLTYASPHQLLQDVRALGGNPLATRERGLFGRQRYQRLLALLEKQRGADGRIALSIEVVYGHA